jgi:hypothetical protein
MSQEAESEITELPSALQDPEDAEAENPSLSTISPLAAHRLASPPDEPRVEIEAGDTLWPRGPAKTVSLAGRGSVYEFLRGDFKYVLVQSRV